MEPTEVVISRDIVNKVLLELNIDASRASIREMTAVVAAVEKETGSHYLRMEFGIPGLEPQALGPEAEIAALRKPRIAATYSPITGLPQLKQEGSRFLKLFLDIEIPEKYVIPTVGSMQGGFISQAISGRCHPDRNHILFIDPGFSVHRMQCKFLGLKSLSVDIYERTKWLDRVEEVCAQGNVGGLIYSTPNNPTWVIFNEEELKRLGEICTRYDVMAIEDAAYFGMDFRRDYSMPGEPPYPPTVARYTDHFVILLSGSKIFSYAGQRAALAYLSPKIAERQYPALSVYYNYTKFYDAFVMGALYCSTSSVPQGPQYALAAFLSMANRGVYRYLNYVREYADRAKVLKKVLGDNGFFLVYADDLGEPLSDGFYFTFAYPGMTGGELVKELLYYGISATTLAIAGSSRTEAVRGCVSQIGPEDFKLFESRVCAFRKDHPV